MASKQCNIMCAFLHTHSLEEEQGFVDMQMQFKQFFLYNLDSKLERLLGYSTKQD